MKHLLLLQTAVLFGAVNLFAGSITLSVLSSSSEVVANQDVTATIEIQGLQSGSNGPALGAYDFLLNYNSALLTDPVVTFGDPVLGDELASAYPSLTCVGTNCGAATGYPLEIGEVSLEPAALLESSEPSAFTLATVTFKADASGAVDFSLSDVTLSDANGNALTVGSTATPEPRTGILIPAAMALGGLLLRRRWSQARA